jgi:hypothetical protein
VPLAGGGGEDHRLAEAAERAEVEGVAGHGAVVPRNWTSRLLKDLVVDHNHSFGLPLIHPHGRRK